MERGQLSEGRQILRAVLTRGRTGPYAVQAAIADLHLHQPRDWPQIAALYETLARQTGSPIVEMNRAIAVAEIHGPGAGLTILDTLELDHYRYFHSTRADLLRRAGRHDEARHAYQRARPRADRCRAALPSRPARRGQRLTAARSGGAGLIGGAPVAIARADLDVRGV